MSYSDDDCEDQALVPTKTCTICLDFDAEGRPIYAPLVKRGRYWCCSNCWASYGECPHPDLAAYTPEKSSPVKLDAKGRCPNCLLKPLSYKRAGHRFCHRCCRSFDMESGAQIQNWAWLRTEAGFNPKHPNADYVKAKPSAATLRAAARGRGQSVSHASPDCNAK